MHRFTISLEDDLFLQVEKVSEKNKHSLSLTVSLLLEKAINERNRKRKKIPAKHNTIDMVQSNSER